MAGPAPAEETGLPGLEGGETGKPSDPFGNDLGDMMEVAAPIGLSTARLDDIDGNDLEGVFILGREAPDKRNPSSWCTA